MGPNQKVAFGQIFAKHGALAALLLLLVFFGPLPGQAQTQTDSSRKVKSSIPPEYPSLARQMGIKGLARVLITVGPDGIVKEVKELGGNPVLVDALSKAVKKWKYEPADRTSVIEVRTNFGG